MKIVDKFVHLKMEKVHHRSGDSQNLMNIPIAIDLDLPLTLDCVMHVKLEPARPAIGYCTFARYRQ